MNGAEAAGTSEAPRPLNAKDRRIIAWTIALIILGAYVVIQVIGLATTKDAVPPASSISVPAGAAIVGEPRTEYSNYRATTHVTVRPPDGQEPAELVAEMGLTEQPTQIGPTLLDWRTVWVYASPAQDVVEIKLAYRPDS